MVSLVRLLRGTLLLALLCLSANEKLWAQAAPDVQRNDQLQSLESFRLEGTWSGTYLGRRLYLYENADRNTSATQALAAILQQPPQRYQGDRPNFGLSRSAHFALFVLENPYEKPLSLFVESNFVIGDFFHLYRLDPTGEPQEILQSGDQQPFTNRSFPSRVINKEIELEAGRHYFLVKTYGNTSLQLPLQVWRPLDFHAQLNHDSIWIGLLLGFHIVMILYNAFLWITVKQRVYLYYIILVAANTVFHVSNLGLGQYLGWKYFGTLTYPNSIQLASVDIIIISGLLFSKSYLEMEKWTRNRWLLPIMHANIALSVFSLTVTHFISHYLTTILVLVGAMVCINAFIIAGVISHLSGFKPARYFLIGWTFYLLGANEAVLLSLGWRDANDINYWSQLWGGAAEVALFSIALGLRLKYLQNQQSKRIAQLNQELMELNQGLERRVEERTRDIHSILNNLQEGVFTVRQDLLIEGDYSPYLEKIFPVSGLAGANLATLLKNHSDLGSNAINQIESLIDICIGEDSLSFAINEGILPRSCHIKNAQGTSLTVELDWVAVYQGSRIEKILVTMRDVTEARKLHESLENKDKELRFVSELMDISAQKFARFAKIAKEIMSDISQILYSENPADQASLQRLLVNYHTLKGMSRTMGFHELSDMIHEAEQMLIDTREQTSPFPKIAVENEHRRILFLLEQYEQTNDVRLGRKADIDTLRVKRQTIIDLIQGIEGLGHDASHVLGSHTHYLKTLYYRSVEDIVYDHMTAIKSVSTELGKLFPRIVFEGLSCGLDPRTSETFEQVLVHLIRNSLDHGIEEPNERKSAGKMEQGAIFFAFTSRPDGFFLQYSDDGRGLNLDAIRQKALAQGIAVDASWNEERLADLIFASGFSTKDTVTSISGRGVGMDAVRSLLGKMGASISIVLHPRQGSHAPFAFCIHFKSLSSMEIGMDYEKRVIAV